MIERLYRHARRLARPLHPNRLRHYVVHSANLLGFQHWRGLLAPRRVAATWRWWRATRAEGRRRRAEKRLTVAVDISAFWEKRTGIGWYLYRLLEHLADRDDVRLRLYGPNLIEMPDTPPPVVEIPRGPALEMVSYKIPTGLSISQVDLGVRMFRRGGQLIAADGNDILFAPNYFLPPWFDHRPPRGRLVATVHDLSFRRVPWTLRESTRQELTRHLEHTARRAERILTDSETVLGELLESGLAERGRVHAVHLGPGPVAASQEKSPLPQGTPAVYVLHVGTLEPRKNLVTLLAAWRSLRQRGAEPPPLVFCGGFGWKTDDLERDMAAAAEEGWLHHFGYLDDGEVAALYRHARLVVLPSIYEGFGLPAVEAMSVGAPLIASDIPVLREVGGDAAVYVTPEDPEAWAAAVELLLSDADRLTDLSRRGQERSRTFDWKRTADGTVEVWKQAAAHRL